MDGSASAGNFGPGGPDSDRLSDATTNLSVAAYTDPAFRDKLLDDICSRRDRALAPSPGVDTALVSRHARRARSSDAFAMAAMWAFLGWRCWTGSYEDLLHLFLAFGCWLIAAWALHRVTAGLKSTVHFAVANRLAGADIAGLAFLLVAVWAAALGARALGLDWHFALPLADLLAVGAIGSGMALYRAIRLLRIQVKRNPWTLWSPRADSLERTQRSEIVIHPDNGGSRFIGFGREEPGREIQVPLVDAAGRRQPPPDTEALIEGVKARIASLGYTVANPAAKSHLEIFEQVHLWDSEITRPVYRLEQWRPDRPQGWRWRFWRRPAPRFTSFAEVRADPDWSSHVHVRFQVSKERGERITNLFFRCEAHAGMLHLEFRPHHLYRTKTRYHLFRDGRAKRVKILATSVILGIATAPLLLPQGPLSLRRTVWHRFRHTSEWLERNLKSEYSNCGPPIGLREMGSDPEPPQRHRSDSERTALFLTRLCLEELRERLRGSLDVTGLEGHIGMVAKEMNAIKEIKVHNEYRLENSAGGTMNVAALGTGARAVVGAVGDSARGLVGEVGDLVFAGEEESETDKPDASADEYRSGPAQER